MNRYITCIRSFASKRRTTVHAFKYTYLSNFHYPTHEIFIPSVGLTLSQQMDDFAIQSVKSNATPHIDREPIMLEYIQVDMKSVNTLERLSCEYVMGEAVIKRFTEKLESVDNKIQTITKDLLNTHFTVDE